MEQPTQDPPVAGETGRENGRRRSIPQIVRSAFDNARDLVRKEIEHAKAQAMRDLMVKLRSVAGLLVAAVLGLIGMVFLLVGAVAGLRLVLPAWAAWLIVGGGLVLIAGAIALVTVRGLKKPPAVTGKIKETVKEDVEWARTHLRPNEKPRTPGGG